MRLEFSAFAGELPAIEPARLPAANAAEAQNCFVRRAVVEPAPAPGPSVATVQAASRSFLRYGNDWLEWPLAVSATKLPVQYDAYDRVAWTGDGNPKWAGRIQILGTSPYPSAAVRLGLPRPATPTATKGTSTGSAYTEDRLYVVTWVGRFGEEGPSSLPVRVDGVEDGQTVTINKPPLPTDPGNEYDVANWIGWRVYRSVVAPGGQFGYLYVGDALITDSTFVDAVASQDLGEPLQSRYWEQAPDAMQHLVALPGGFLAGAKDNYVCFSEIGAVHAWPPAYQRPIPETIRGLAVIENALIVLTDGQPYYAFVNDPAGAVLQRALDRAPLATARSIAVVGGEVLYASEAGIVAVAPGGSLRLVTAGVFTEAQWQALNPGTIEAGVWRGLYVFSYEETPGVRRVLFLDPAAPDAGVFRLPYGYEAFFEDLAAERLYGKEVGGTDLLPLFEDYAGAASYVWRSGVRLLPAPTDLKWAKVHASQYPVTLRVFEGGRLVDQVLVRTAKAVRVTAPGLYDVQVELRGTAPVRAVVLASSVSEL